MTAMTLLLMLIALFLQHTMSHPQIHSEPRMVNGVRTFASRYPFIAVVRVVAYDSTNTPYAAEAFCGASLIRKEYPAAFLSASHCVYNDTDEVILQLYTTDTDQQPIMGWTGYPILSSIVHEQFNSVSLAHDISLLFIDADLTTRNELQTVTVPNLINPSSAPSPCCSNADTLQVIGYGRTGLGGPYSNTLEYTNLRYIGTNGCNRQYCLLETGQANCPFSYVLTMNICAVGNQTTPCHGDSGGPLIKLGTTEQVGVVSWGIGCITWLPTIFTNTGLYYQWIEDKLNQYQGNDIQWPVYPWTPTSDPTLLFTDFPSVQPTNDPTAKPTNYPSPPPTNRPTGYPINLPSKFPSGYPTNKPSFNPTNIPSINPTNDPSFNPTSKPSYNPTILPSVSPSDLTVSPTRNPTPTLPFPSPTPHPTQIPTISPTPNPSKPPQSTYNPTKITTSIIKDNPVRTGFPNPTSNPSVAISTAIPTSVSIPDTTESSKPKETYMTTEDTMNNTNEQTVALILTQNKKGVDGLTIALCIAGSIILIVIGCVLLKMHMVSQGDHKQYETVETVTSIAEIDKSNVTVIEPHEDENIPSETDAIIDYNTIKTTEPINISISSGDGKNDPSISSITTTTTQ